MATGKSYKNWAGAGWNIFKLKNVELIFITSAVYVRNSMAKGNKLIKFDWTGNFGIAMYSGEK